MADLPPVVSLLAGLAGGLAIAGWPRWGRRRRSRRRGGDRERSVPVVAMLTEGRVQRGNGSGGPTTPKPAISPEPQLPPIPRRVRVRVRRRRDAFMPTPTQAAQCGGPCLLYGVEACNCDGSQFGDPGKRPPISPMVPPWPW